MKNFLNNSKSLLVKISAVGMLSVLFSSCLKDNNNGYNPPVALVTFIQASPNEPVMDFFMNNNMVNYQPISYGQNVDYFRAFAGNRTANFYNHFTNVKILADTVQLSPNTSYSLFLANIPTHPQALLLTDTISQPAAGKATIRFVNVSADAPAVDFAITGGSVLATNKAYKGFSSFVAVTANANTSFEVRQKGTTTVLATLTGINVQSGYVYTIWLQGIAGSSAAADKLSVGIVTNAIYY